MDAVLNSGKVSVVVDTVGKHVNMLVVPGIMLALTLVWKDFFVYLVQYILQKAGMRVERERPMISTLITALVLTVVAGGTVYLLRKHRAKP